MSNSGVWWRETTPRDFDSGRGSAHTLFWQTLDGQGGVQPVFSLGRVGGPIAFASWSPDGRTIVFDALAPRTGLNIWSVRLDRDKVPKPFIQTALTKGGQYFHRTGNGSHISQTRPEAWMCTCSGIRDLATRLVCPPTAVATPCGPVMNRKCLSQRQRDDGRPNRSRVGVGEPSAVAVSTSSTNRQL